MNLNPNPIECSFKHLQKNRIQFNHPFPPTRGLGILCHAEEKKNKTWTIIAINKDTNQSEILFLDRESVLDYLNNSHIYNIRCLTSTVIQHKIDKKDKDIDFAVKINIIYGSMMNDEISNQNKDILPIEKFECHQLEKSVLDCK